MNTCKLYKLLVTSQSSTNSSSERIGVNKDLRNMVKLASTSNAIWWIKNPKAAGEHNSKGKRKNSLGSAFCLDMADLVRNISLQGYNKLLSPDLTLGQRYKSFPKYYSYAT